MSSAAAQKVLEAFKPYGIYNVDESKRPYDYNRKGFLWDDQAKRGSGYTFYPDVEKYGFWTGRKHDGSYIITIDFDIYDRKGGYNEKLEEVMNELFEEIDYQGVFSSSTEGNYQVVLDI